MARTYLSWPTRKNFNGLDNAAWIVAPPILAFMSVTFLILAENPFFFSAHNVSPLALMGFGLAVVVVASLIAWLLLGAVKKWGPPRLFDWTASILVYGSVLISMLAISVKIFSSFLPSSLAWISGLVISLLVAVGVTRISRQSRSGRGLLTVATVVSIAPLALVAFNTANTTDPVTVSFDDSADRPPILLVVADELSYSVVATADGTVRTPFQNLAKLQDTSTTFTRAYSTANATHFALPTMLAGIADASTLGEYPVALTGSGGPLSWLKSRYVVATDSDYFRPNNDGVPFVDLTQESLVNERLASPSERWGLLAIDLVAIAGRTALPEPLAGLFPSLDDRWYDFWGTLPETSVVDTGRDFVDVLAADDNPGFVLWHSMVPHTPYVRDYVGGFWTPNSLGLSTDGLGTTAVIELQRQVYVAAALDFDGQLGWMMNELQRAGVFDETLIIVTADHGRTFPLNSTWRVGDNRSERWGDVAHVPLFVKWPGQKIPTVETGVRSLAQISRTIVDAAGAELSIRDELAPSLNEDPSQPPVFWFDKRTGEAGVETYEAFPYMDPWRPEHYRPRSDDSPFAVGIDSALIGEEVPVDWLAVAQIPATIDPASSSLQALEVSRPVEACGAGEDFGLVSHEGRTVGSIAWGAANDGVVTGWAIVPEFDFGEYQFWCRGR